MKRAVKPKDDPALLARVAEFRKLYRVYKAAWRKFAALRKAVEAEPDCPPLIVGGPFDQPRHRYLERQGVWKVHEQACERLKATGKAARAIFAMRARTPLGVLAKLEIVELAYGRGDDSGDLELHGYQRRDNWQHSAIADLRWLAKGGGR